MWGSRFIWVWFSCKGKIFPSQGKQKSILLALMGVKETYEKGGFNHRGQFMVARYFCLGKTHIMKCSLYQRGNIYLSKSTVLRGPNPKQSNKSYLSSQCWALEATTFHTQITRKMLLSGDFLCVPLTFYIETPLYNVKTSHIIHRQQWELMRPVKAFTFPDYYIQM